MISVSKILAQNDWEYLIKENDWNNMKYDIFYTFNNTQKQIKDKH